MNKSDLIARVAKKLEVTNTEAEHLVSVVLDEIMMSVKDSGRLTLTGFGSFDQRSRKERQGRNPQTGESIMIPQSKTIGFRPSKNWKENIDG